MCTYIANKLERGSAFISSSWVPKSPYTFAFATCAGIYGKRLGETYAAGYISNIFINRSAAYTLATIGNETIGRAAGIAIVAPMLTPELTTLAVFAAGCVMFYVAVLIGNLIHKIFTHCCKKPTTMPTT
jgi:hypothetical protein